MSGLKRCAFWLTWTLVAAVCLWGCSSRRTDLPMTAREHFVTWQGPFSEEALKDCIDLYKETCTPLSRTGTGTPVSVPAGQADKVSVSRLSSVGDGYEELDRYIDLAVNCQYDEGSGEWQVDTGWWFDAADRAQNAPTWSYLIRTAAGDTETYWYFRVTFTS